MSKRESQVSHSQTCSDKPQIITRPHPPIEVCFQCGAINPFRQSRGTRHYPAFDVAPAKCRNCGALAQIRTVHYQDKARSAPIDTRR